MKLKSDFSYTQTLEEAAHQVQVDETAGVIKGVVLLTGNKVSHNRTKYLDKAVQEAVGRYEGAKMYVDHPSKADLEQRKGVRSVRDLAGTFRNVRREGDKVVADAHVLEHQRSWILPIAKQRPAGVGLSIRDRGHTSQDKDGVVLVEGFEPGAMFSVDLVSEVSLNTDLFESKQAQGGNDMEFDKLTKEQLAEHRKDLVEAIEAPIKAQLEEALKALAAGKAKELASAKAAALAEAKLPKEAEAAVKVMISKETVTLDEAKTIVAEQAKMVKSLEEAFAARKPGSGAPAVRMTEGHEKPLEEGKNELPSLDVLAEALKG